MQDLAIRFISPEMVAEKLGLDLDVILARRDELGLGDFVARRVYRKSANAELIEVPVSPKVVTKKPARKKAVAKTFRPKKRAAKMPPKNKPPRKKPATKKSAKKKVGKGQ